MDEFKDYVYQNYFLDGYGVIHILELDELSEKFNLDIKKVKQELKKLKCKIYKPMKKVNEKNVDFNKIDNNNFKLIWGARIPQYVQEKNVRKACGTKIWNNVRAELIEKTGCTCTICGYHTQDTAELDAHEIWEIDEENCVLKLKKIVLICKRCHQCHHPESSIMKSIENDQKKNVEREISKKQLLDIHMMRVNQCNQDTLIQYKLQKEDLKEQREAFFRLRLNPKTGKPMDEEYANKIKRLKSSKWYFYVEDNIPCHDEIISKLKEKDLYYEYK